MLSALSFTKPTTYPCSMILPVQVFDRGSKKSLFVDAKLFCLCLSTWYFNSGNGKTALPFSGLTTQEMAPSFDLVDDAIDVVEAFEIKRCATSYEKPIALGSSERWRCYDERICWLQFMYSSIVSSLCKIGLFLLSVSL